MGFVEQVDALKSELQDCRNEMNETRNKLSLILQVVDYVSLIARLSGSLAVSLNVWLVYFLLFPGWVCSSLSVFFSSTTLQNSYSCLPPRVLLPSYLAAFHSQVPLLND